MNDTIRVINRVFDIIEILAVSDHPMSLTEIVTESGISKSTVYRLLHTLHERHYVEKDSNSCYRIGIKLIETASNHINRLELQTESKPVLATLREGLNLAAHLGILDGMNVVYVEKLDLYPTTRLYTQIGYRSPAYPWENVCSLLFLGKIWMKFFFTSSLSNSLPIPLLLLQN